MEFFDWLSVPQFFFEYFLSSFMPLESTAEDAAAYSNLVNYISLGVAGGFYLLLILFGGLGLRKMAKNAGQKPSFLSFLPFGNTYVSGKLAGEANFFGQKMKRTGLYAMLAEIVYSAVGVFRIVLNFLLTKADYFVERTIEGTEVAYWQLDRSRIPENMRWTYDALNYTGIASYILLFVVIVLFVTLYMALFRKYYSRSPLVMTLLCTIFPFRGFTLFAVRNNAPVNYEEFMRRRAEEFSRRQGYPQNQNTPPSSPPPTDFEDPFAEFDTQPKDKGEGGDDPFGL